MSGVFDDPQYKKKYMRKYREEHREELNEKDRERRRNRPAAPGVKGRGRPGTGWLDVAYCTENQYADEISWDINK